MIAAAGLPAQVVGVALLNSAGQFGNANSKTEETEETLLQKSIIKPLKEIFQRIVLGFLFWQAKQPARVKSVLKSVCHFLPNLTRVFISKLNGYFIFEHEQNVYYLSRIKFLFSFLL